MLHNLLNYFNNLKFKIIFKGDANSRMGEITGDKKWGKNGHKLFNLCYENRLIIINSILHYNIATYHRYWKEEIFNNINSNSDNYQNESLMNKTSLNKTTKVK